MSKKRDSADCESMQDDESGMAAKSSVAYAPIAFVPPHRSATASFCAARSSSIRDSHMR